jgi:type II secretory pathway pseudopilin PulG
VSRLTNIVGVIKAQEKEVAALRGINERAESARKDSAAQYDLDSANASAARYNLHQARAVLTQLQAARHTQRTGHEGPRDKPDDFDDLDTEANGWAPGGIVRFTKIAQDKRTEHFPSDTSLHIIASVELDVLDGEHDVIYFPSGDANPVKTGWNKAWLELA